MFSRQPLGAPEKSEQVRVLNEIEPPSCLHGKARHILLAQKRRR
jgi:hypothetical protein